MDKDPKPDKAVESRLFKEPVDVMNGDIKLAGNFFYPPDEEAKHPAVLFLQGWGSKQEGTSRDLAESFSEKGFVCLTIDLRGHGKSPGGDSPKNKDKYTREDFLSDATAAYDALAKNEKVNPSNITILGVSFGAYMGAILSSKRDVRQLIFRSPANYPDEGFNSPGLPTSDQPEILQWRKEKLGAESTISLKAIRHFSGKALIVESGSDEQVPFQTTENYLEAFPKQENVTHGALLFAKHSISDEETKDKFKKMVLDWLLANGKESK